MTVELQAPAEEYPGQCEDEPAESGFEAQRLASTREPEYQGIEEEDLDDADAILGLLKEQAR